MSDTDILGNPTTDAERAMLAAYDGLKGLLEHDLSPAAEAAVREAITSLWQAVNNLCLTDDRPDAG